MSENLMPQAVLILKNLVKATEIKETHISYALLTDEFVYKVKKSVNFGFLDYTSAKNRKYFSVMEKDLNSRFSTGIYEDVLKIVKKSATEFDLVSVDSTLTAVEYVLKMKRIKNENFLQNRIDNNQVTLDEMVKIGESVAKLLINLDNAPHEEELGTTCDVVKFNAVENFNQTEKYVGTFIDTKYFNFIQNATLKFINNNVELFNERSKDGFIKNGHGDLRLEHIYFNEDGSIGLIDCIEFNKRFRYQDTIAEAAFLSMEMDYNGLIDFSDAFLTGFLTIVNDDSSLKLLNYYRSYFAYVRAKVACFSIDGADINKDFFDKKTSEISRLINLSLYYLLNVDSTLTLLFYGIMGTGKTRNAKEFSKTYPIYNISTDEVRKNNAGVHKFEKVYVNYGAGLYSAEKSNEVYEILGKIAEDKAKIGRSTLIDGSFIEEEYYNIIHRYNLGSIHKYKFTAPDDVIFARLKERLEKNVVSDGRPALYEEQKRRAKMPDSNLTIETTGNIKNNITAIIFNLINI